MPETIYHISMQKNFGGGENQIFLLLNYISRFNHILLCPAGSILHKKSGSLQHRIKSFRIFSLFNPIPFLWVLFNIDNQSIIHAHDGKACAFAALIKILCLLMNKKVYFIAHRRVNIPIHGISRLKYSTANLIIAISKSVKKTLIFSGIRSRIPVVYSSIHPETSQEDIKTRYKIPENAPVAVSTIRIETDKGIYDLLQMYALVKNVFPDFHLVIFGEGSQYNNALSVIRENNYDSVIMPGFIERPERYYNKCFAYISCSYNEGLGTAVMGALSQGLPVIAYDVGGLSETVINEQTGFLVEKGFTEKIAEKVLWLLNNCDICRKMSEQAQHSSFISDNNMVKSHEKIYSLFFRKKP